MPQINKSLLVCLLILTVVAGCANHQSSIAQTERQSPGTVENHWVQTEDNWSLHVRRYKPSKLDPSRHPVILCHGLSHNNTIWDLTENTSLAQYLQASGYDVWAVSLRGSGQSTKPTLSQIKQLFRLQISMLNPRGIINRSPGLLRLNWTVDDHINYDIPAVLDYVTDQAGTDEVYWVGHSMGSMIMFAWLGTRETTKVKGFVAVAAPMYHVRPANDVYELMAEGSNLVKVGNMATGTNFRAIVGVMTGKMVNTPIDQLFLNVDNVNPATLRLFYYATQEDISPGQLDQLLEFLKRGNFVSYDGTINYTLSVQNIRTPVLQVVGQLDNMADSGFVTELHQWIGSEDKQVRVFGRINGYRTDYGHNDILIGRHSRQEVFPYIRDWLNTQSRKTERKSSNRTDGDRKNL